MQKNHFANFLVFCFVSTSALSSLYADTVYKGAVEVITKQKDPSGSVEVVTKQEARDKEPHKSSVSGTPQTGKVASQTRNRGPKIQVKGAAAFNVYTGSQKNKTTISYEPAAGALPTDSKTRGASKLFGFDDTKLEFEISQACNVLWFYQWKINVSFSADKSASAPNNIKQAYITLNSRYSTTEFGNYSGVEDRMGYSSVSILGGTGGFDGNSQKFALPTTGTHTSVDLIGDSGEATKINLLSARWNGIMLGFSYTPSTAHFGGTSLSTYGSPSYGSSVGKPYSADNFAAGLNYVGFLTSNLKLSASLTGVMAKSKPEVGNKDALKRRDIRSYAVGAVLSYKNFSFAGEYADCGKSMQFSQDVANVNPLGLSGDLLPLNYNASEATAPKFFDFGIAYIYDKTKFAIGYLQSSRKTGFDGIKATAKVWNASITQQVAVGLSVYLEGFNYNTKNNAVDYETKLLAQGSEKTAHAVGNQKAKVVIVGMKASF